jgi:transposase InsO family protein
MSKTSIKQKKWLFNNNWPYYLQDPWFKPFKPLDTYERWRRVAKILKVSKKARLRLEWIIYYYQGHGASQTSRHFGLSRKTFHKWFREFDPDNIYSMYRLQDKSRAPNHTRQREITSIQEQRIIDLRKKHIRYGKIKLAKLYEQEYQEYISSWHIQKVIEAKKLYYHPVKTARISRKRQRAQKKKRITELGKIPWFKKKAGYIICLDTIVIYQHKLKRYIFTAIDKYGKFAYARMYKTKSSLNGEDFLYRLRYLLDGKVPRVGHDNGSEFEKFFKKACQKLKIEQYYNRPRTPKDNPVCERFNQTLQTEFLNLGNFTPDVDEFNRRLTEWLIEYNFKRPHQALGYKTPVEFLKATPKDGQVLPMCSSCTRG